MSPQEPKRYIFFDVNGVLQIAGRLDPVLLDRFAQLVKETDATVVLSSMWRKYGHSLKVIRDALRDRGVQLFSTTPQCDSEEIKDNPRRHEGRHCGDTKRTHEILLWLEDHHPQSWVAIDDELLALRPEHFVHTDPHSGFTEEKAVEAKEKMTPQRVEDTEE